MMKKIIVMTALLLMVTAAFAQQDNIDVNLMGFGKTGNEVIITIHNTGLADVKSLEVKIDGNLYRKMDLKLLSGSGFEMTLFLQNGKHIIEVRSDTGGYDSVEVSVMDVEPKPVEKPAYEEKKSEIIIILIVSLLVILGFIWYIGRRKRKLKL